MAASKKSIYFILGSTILIWGLNMVLIKYLTQYMSPLLVSAVRNSIAGLVMLPFVWKKFGFYKPTPKQWALVILIGAMSYALHQVLVAFAVMRTTATNAALIMGLYPLFTALLAALFIGEKFNRKLGIGIALGFAGVFLVVTAKDGSALGLSGWGDVIMFAAMLAYVVGCLFVKKLSETPIPNFVGTTYSVVVGAIVSHLGYLFLEGPAGYRQIPVSLPVWAVLLVSAVGACTLGNLGWNHGIKFLGANKTALFLNGMPLASMIAGAVFLHERIGWVHVLALGLISTGIIASTKKQEPRLPETIKM